MDNTNFYKTIEAKNDEVNYLKKQLKDAIEDNEKLVKEKQTLEENSNSIHSAKLKAENQLAQYISEHKRLNENIYEQREELKRQENEKTKLVNRIEDLKYELESANKKITSKDENILILSSQLDQTNEELLTQVRKIKDLENTIHKQECDLESFHCQLKNQKLINSELDKRLELTEAHSREKDKEIHILKNEITNERISYEDLNNEKNKILGERERLKHQVGVLMEQNYVLSEEVQILVDRDEKIRIQLERRPRTKNILDENRRVLENSCYEVNQIIENTSSPSNTGFYNKNNYIGNNNNYMSNANEEFRSSGNNFYSDNNNFNRQNRENDDKSYYNYNNNNNPSDNNKFRSEYDTKREQQELAGFNTKYIERNAEFIGKYNNNVNINSGSPFNSQSFSKSSFNQHMQRKNLSDQITTDTDIEKKPTTLNQVSKIVNLKENDKEILREKSKSRDKSKDKIQNNTNLNENELDKKSRKDEDFTNNSKAYKDNAKESDDFNNKVNNTLNSNLRYNFDPSTANYNNNSKLNSDKISSERLNISNNNKTKLEA